ncbi:MAG: transglycosylase domain-containing protein [Haliscomenobacter sp.]|nr:transglycosylase domain-containing protein [Haliscomenobacter sp.]MBP9075692.1 transglycosylase domain-containing protein [Haliscomenobacter sp.]MBP9872647.1 transglycosylase domain-containing protein [Haliscomenobacter sp.]
MKGYHLNHRGQSARQIIESALSFLRQELKELFSWPPNWAKWAVYGFISVKGIAVFLQIFALLIYNGAFGPLPTRKELKDIRNSNASEVYSADGAILGRYFIQNRVNADLEEIPASMINGLIATEDARFTQHRGIDLRAMIRVLVKSILLSRESSGGGSTLSQQLAKNLYPRQNYGRFSMIVNKFKEMFTARRLEKLYTKEELLGLYLNTVPFSDNIYGVKVAAHRFFAKVPQNLNVEEAAVLIGMLKGPSLYHPVKHPERAQDRRNVVLRQMQKYGYLTPEETDSLCVIPMKLTYSVDSHSEGLATYFREHLRLELEKILRNYKKPDGTPYNLYSDGLKVYTTLDARLQRYAEQAVFEHMPQLQAVFNREWRRGDPWGKPEVLQTMVRNTPRYKELKARGMSEKEIAKTFNEPRLMTVFSWEEGIKEVEMSPLDSVKYYLRLLNMGFLAMDPSSGAIKAWVGGIDFAHIQYDHVKSRRQVGSTFKPIVYAQALEAGIDPCQLFPNELLTYEEYENWTPENADGQYGGYYSMEGALTHSVNTVSVQLIMETGVGPVRNLAEKMGIDGAIPKGPSLALGTAEASLMEMVQVFGTIGNRGVRPEIHYLDRIETADGEVLVQFTAPSAKVRALSQQTADEMIHMLRSVVEDGTASRLRWRYGLSNVDLAGKTGTTQNQSDGWFIGITPRLVAGAWVGAESPSVHFRSLANGQGANTALPIFGGFMRRVYNDRRYQSWKNARFAPLPDSVAAAMACPPFVHPDSTGYDSLFQNMGDIQFFQMLQAELNGEEQKEFPVRLRPQRPNEPDSLYLNRMIRFNERVQDREKRKEEWSKILFGKNEEAPPKKNNEPERN